MIPDPPLLDYERCQITIARRGLIFHSWLVTVDVTPSQAQLRIVQEHSLLMRVVFYTATGDRVHAFEIIERRAGPWCEELPDEDLARITHRNAQEGVDRFRDLLRELAGGADGTPPFDPDEMAERVIRASSPSKRAGEDDGEP